MEVIPELPPEGLKHVVGAPQVEQDLPVTCKPIHATCLAGNEFLRQLGPFL